MKKMDHLVKKGGKANFQRYLKKKNKLKCYECGKSGHMRNDCYKLKKEGASSSKRPKEGNEKNEKHKGFNAQWDGIGTDSDASKNSDENALCFMAFEDSSHKVIYQSSLCSDIDDDDECEKLKMIEVLKDKCDLFLSKMKVYKEKYTCLDKELGDLKLIVNSLKSSNDELKKNLQDNLNAQSSIRTLEIENEKLKKELESVNNTISKFHKGKGNLDNLLLSQRPTSIKYGLGYEGASTSSTKPIEFVKSSNVQTSSLDAPKVDSNAFINSTKGKLIHIYQNESHLSK